jgi:hypothetical protein
VGVTAKSKDLRTRCRSEYLLCAVPSSVSFVPSNPTVTSDVHRCGDEGSSRSLDVRSEPDEERGHENGNMLSWSQCGCILPRPSDSLGRPTCRECSSSEAERVVITLAARSERASPNLQRAARVPSRMHRNQSSGLARRPPAFAESLPLERSWALSWRRRKPPLAGGAGNLAEPSLKRREPSELEPRQSIFSSAAHVRL